MLLSMRNRRNGDIIMDENGIVRHKDTPPVQVPQRPVLLDFDEEEVRARRRWLGLDDPRDR